MSCCTRGINTTESVLIDCRSHEKFIHGHHISACSLPASSLFERMHELPQKNVPLELIGDQQSLGQATLFLTQKGYQVIQTQQYKSDTILALQEQNQWRTGASDIILWQASAMIKHFCQHPNALDYNTNKIGLDIGCGSGRDMVYLAKNGWEMHGIDYQKEALQRSQLLAHNNQLNIHCYQQDLEKNARPFEQLHPQGLPRSFDLITVCRYLHRPLLANLKALLNPGGYIIYQTFMQGCEKISSPKNPNFLLKENELKHYFEDFTLINNEVVHLPDGRPFSAFIAQRPK